MHSSSQGLIRLWIVGLLLLLTLLTACSGQGEKASRASGSEGVPGAAAPSASAISNAAPAAQPVIHKFKHVMGEIEWSTPPKRVVGIYTEDFLLALGVKPVTQTVIGNFSLKYLLPEIGNLPKLDTSAISFEAALQAEPDLFVLGFANYGAEGRYEKFSKIAPTYVLPADAPNNWRDTLRTIGELVGKPEEADKVLKQYSEKVAAAKKTLETSVGRETVALVRIRSNKEIRLYGGPQGYSGSVLYQDLGLEPPAIVKKLSWGESGGTVPISMEVLPELDSQHLFVTIDDGGRELAKELMNSSIWKNLPAVKNNRVHEVDVDHWMTFGPIAYNKKVDDVLKALGK